jgi:hypothetical protein
MSRAEEHFIGRAWEMPWVGARSLGGNLISTKVGFTLFEPEKSSK